MSTVQDAMQISENVSVSERISSLTSMGQLTLFAGETPARRTLTPVETESEVRRSVVNSSALLMNCARVLFSGRIHQSSKRMPRGRGGDSDLNWSEWDTLCCPSDSEPVALGLISEGTACSCSVNYRAPNARDWKGMSAKSWREREKGDKTPTLHDQIGGVPLPEFVEEVCGFPIGWSDLKG